MATIECLCSLDVDAMYFHSALNNLERAVRSRRLADDGSKELNSITWLNDYEAWDLGDDIDVSFSPDEVNYIEGVKQKVRESSSHFLQAIASTQMFCVAALEAHINKRRSWGRPLVLQFSKKQKYESGNTRRRKPAFMLVARIKCAIEEQNKCGKLKGVAQPHWKKCLTFQKLGRG